MNVLQLIGSFHQGGSERQAVQLTRLLCEDGTHKIFAATLNNEGVLQSEIARLNLPEIREFKLTSFHDANLLKQLKNCRDYLRQNEIEVVQTHDFYTNVFGMLAARWARIPLKIAAKRETGGMRSNSQKIIEKVAFKIADKIVVNSLAVKNYLTAEKVRADKIKIIYNGLDLERLKPKMTDAREIRTMLNLPTDENAKFVTLVANLRHTVKNQPMLLRAAAKVIARYPNAHFVLAGEGELKTQLENTARELKIERNTHFIGRCSHVPELLYISTVGTLTSFNEGFSNSILEYMAAGLPVVATNVGGAAEAIVENETGFLIKSDDDETMANRLIELLESEAKIAAFGENGRRAVAEKFSLETQLQKTLELYEN